MPRCSAPSISTGVPRGFVPVLQPLVSVCSPRPAQCAAMPMNSSPPCRKMKLAVQPALPMISCTPGWIGAWSAGANVAWDTAAGANPSPMAIVATAKADTVNTRRTIRARTPAASKAHSPPGQSARTSRGIRRGSPGSSRIGQTRVRERWPARRSAGRGQVGGQHVVALGRGRAGRPAGRAAAGGCPVACSTASGNLAGWAVARHTIGTSGSVPQARAAPMPTAVWGSTSIPVRWWRSRITSRVAASSMLAAVEPGVPRAPPREPTPRKRPSSSAVRGAVAAEQLEQQPLVVRRHLDVHRRAQRGHDRLGAPGRRWRPTGRGCRCGSSR